MADGWQIWQIILTFLPFTEKNGHNWNHFWIISVRTKIRPTLGNPRTKRWSSSYHALVASRPKCGLRNSKTWSHTDQKMVMPRPRRGTSIDKKKNSAASRRVLLLFDGFYRWCRCRWRWRRSGCRVGTDVCRLDDVFL